MFSSVQPSTKVLLIWSDLGSVPEQLQAAVEQIQAAVGAAPKVCVENAERLSMSGHQASSFTQVFSGCLGLATVKHDLDLLAQMAKLLAPGGQLTMVQAVQGDISSDSLTSTLVLAGLASSSSPCLLSSFPGFEETVAKLGQVQLYSYTASKPQHEVGASRLLSFAKPVIATPVVAAASVWTLEDMDDDTVELVDDQTLLADEDLAKPDPASLRVSIFNTIC